MQNLSVTVVDSDPELADANTRLLARELSQLDANVTLAPATTAEAGAKGTLQAVTTVLVALAGSQPLTQLSMALRDFVNRDRTRKLVVKDGDRSIEITGPVTAEQRTLIDDFLGTDK